MHTAALALAIMECFSAGHRAHPGAEARARIYAAQVELAATAARIDPFLVVALIERESGWHEMAVGSRGEVGLLQLLPHTEPTRGYDAHPSALFNPPINIRLGVAWMAVKRRRCHTADPLLWLSSYRGGKCRPTPYSRAIVARAGELRGIAQNLVVEAP